MTILLPAEVTPPKNKGKESRIKPETVRCESATPPPIHSAIVIWCLYCNRYPLQSVNTGAHEKYSQLKKSLEKRKSMQFRIEPESTTCESATLPILHSAVINWRLYSKRYPLQSANTGASNNYIVRWKTYQKKKGNQVQPSIKPWAAMCESASTPPCKSAVLTEAFIANDNCNLPT